MKRTILSIFSLFFLAFSFAQTTESLKKPLSIGGSFFIKDYPSCLSTFRLNVRGWNKELAPGVNGLITTGLSSHFDFVGTLGACYTKAKSSKGYFFYYNGVDKYNGNERVLLELSTLVNYKILTDDKRVVPYLTLGLGTSFYGGTYFLPYVPMGAGLQFKLNNDKFMYAQVLLQQCIKTGDYNETKENLNYSVGMSFPLKKRTINKFTAKPIVILDSDNDGIPDSIDKCPYVVGFAKYNGCPIPDTDGDGINDEQDSCPFMPGLAKYHGCPIPDSDKDGINDEEDSCPTVPGVAKYHGCPIPDRDGDGINDEEDKCPDEPGIAANKGCPDIQSKMNELAKSIFFNTKSSIIAKKAYPVMDQVVALTKKYPDFKLEIEGHTDNIGSAVVNQKLSQKRADAIKKYFLSKGVNASRLYAIGYGKEKPIASNKTPTGRAMNRRVELHAKYQ